MEERKKIQRKAFWKKFCLWGKLLRNVCPNIWINVYMNQTLNRKLNGLILILAFFPDGITFTHSALMNPTFVNNNSYFPHLNGTSVEEHERTVCAQQGYDSVFINSVISDYHGSWKNKYQKNYYIQFWMEIAFLSLNFYIF